MEGFDSLGVVAAAELHNTDHLLGLIDDEGVRQLLAAAGVGQQIFASPRPGPLRRDLFEPEPHGGDTEVVRGLQSVFEIAPRHAAEELSGLFPSRSRLCTDA